jgi:hypothetical protein
VVIVTNYAPPEMIAQIEGTGIPVVAISLLDVPPAEAVKLSPFCCRLVDRKEPGRRLCQLCFEWASMSS